MRLLITFLALCVVVGCSSTSPYRDDYARHINYSNKAPFTAESFRIVIADKEHVDLRATYDNDNTVGNSNVIYQGGAGAGGLIALVAQIGVHSSLVSSQREEKLAEMQNSANQKIMPLLDITNSMSVSELIPVEQTKWIASADDDMPLHIKPIFFSSPDMSELGVKMVIWLPDPNGTKKRPNKYKNLIQVFSKPFSDTTKAQLKAGDKLVLKQHLSSLLSLALDLTRKATTGQYPNNTGNVRTFKILKQGKVKVIRATEVASTCQHTIVRDLRKWLIAIPKKRSSEEQISTETSLSSAVSQQCFTKV